MMKWFRKKQADFYKLLLDQANLSTSGVEALQDFLKDGGESSAGRVNELEKDADEARRILIDELNKTFATPMDREDIFSLSRAVDDVIDYAESTVDEMSLLGVKPNQHLQKMGSVLAKGMSEIGQSLQRLENNPAVANEHAIKAKKQENEMEKIYRNALVELFQGDDIVRMLKLREIYRHLSNAADRCDEAANIITDIIVKQT